jgi:hypothetical protein
MFCDLKHYLAREGVRCTRYILSFVYLRYTNLHAVLCKLRVLILKIKITSKHLWEFPGASNYCLWIASDQNTDQNTDPKVAGFKKGKGRKEN